MTSRLLGLPGELKLQIVEHLSPSAATSSDFECKDYRTLADELDDTFKSVWGVRNLARSCREMRAFCGTISYHGVQLFGGEGHKRFLEDVDNGTLPVNISDTKFLSIGHFDTHDPGWEDSEEDRYLSNLSKGVQREISPKDYDPEAIWFKYTERDQNIRRIFTHFSSVTTLELINFPFCIHNVYALSPMTALQTLSILDPDPESHRSICIRRHEDHWPKQLLTNVSVVLSDIRACGATSNVLRVFADKIITLSLKSDEAKVAVDDPDRKLDFLDCNALHLQSTPTFGFTKLKHLFIGYLRMSTRTFRQFLNGCKSLESLSVNCRGMKSPLPLFYVFDLLNTLTGESDDDIDMMGYDWLPDNVYATVNMEPAGPMSPYIEESKIWLRSVASLTCSFGPRQGPDATKATKHLALVLGSGIDADMKFEDLTEAFHDRAMSFQKLESLSIEMSDEVTFKPSESELKATVLEMHHQDLPSVTKFHVKWGGTEIFLDLFNP